MAQATIRRPTAANQVLPVAAHAAITGLTATILTGSGWVIATILATLLDSSAAANQVYFRLSVDGANPDDCAIAVTVPASGRATICGRFALKIGAGQHVILAEGYAAVANVAFIDKQGALIIEEPGY